MRGPTFWSNARFLRDLETTLRDSGTPALSAFKITRTVERAYTKPPRRYHTLAHLEHLNAQLTPLRERMLDPAFFAVRTAARQWTEVPAMLNR